MVEVVYQPWKKIVIHEVVEYSLNDLVKLQSLGVEPGGLGDFLLWADGIVFSSSTMLETKDIVKEKLEGIAHWSSVEWARMPEFEEIILIRETNVKVFVINVSGHPIYRTVSKWLKEYREPDTS